MLPLFLVLAPTTCHIQHQRHVAQPSFAELLQLLATLVLTSKFPKDSQQTYVLQKRHLKLLSHNTKVLHCLVSLDSRWVAPRVIRDVFSLYFGSISRTLFVLSRIMRVSSVLG